MILAEDTLREKYLGSLLGAAVLDALGRITENMTAEQISQKFTVVDDYKEGSGFPKGAYSDDTQQTIILTDYLLENGFPKENHYDLKRYAQQIAKRTELKRGIGPSLYAFLLNRGKVERDNIPFVNMNIATPSNGLAMKIAPIPLLYRQYPAEINEVIEQLGSLTHPHRGSVAGAIGIAHAIHYVLEHPENRFCATDYIDTIVTQVKRYDECLARIISNAELIDENSASVYATVPQAILAFAKEPTQFRNGGIKLIHSGYDTDTKASMFGAISGAYNGIKAIPQSWIDGLENGSEGKDYIVSLAGRLFAASQNRIKV